MKFYTYLWLREDGTPYYVGKGTLRRVLEQSGHRVFRPIEKERIVVQEFPTEADAFFSERFLIAYYGRLDLKTGCLANLTNGGEGASGQSETLRRQKSAALQGHPVLYETREKIRNARSRQDMSFCKKDICKRGHLRVEGNVDSNGTCLMCKKVLRTPYSHESYLRRRLREGHV